MKHPFLLGAFLLPIFAHAQINTTPDTTKINQSKDVAGSISSTVKGKTSNASRLNETQIDQFQAKTICKPMMGRHPLMGKLSVKDHRNSCASWCNRQLMVI